MEIKFEHSRKEVSRMDTEELRNAFLAQGLVQDNALNSVYSHYDRIIIGGVKPVSKAVELIADAELKAAFFLERREIGIINIGGKGIVEADGVSYDLEKLSCLYLGKGVRQVLFKSADAGNPPIYFFMSAPAHHTYPSQVLHKDQASPVALGEAATSNKRTIYKYIHLDGIKSCQLVMGLTVLEAGSVWNSIPPHTHTRRTEAYFYFDLPENQRLFHIMGEPTETRHLVMANHEAVVSPPWSVHCGCGTSSYAFIWAMAGENQVFTDMDVVTVPELK